MTIREQAIRICEIAASEEITPTLLDSLVLSGDFAVAAGDLADQAHEHVLCQATELDDRRQAWSEAAAILRDGWEP